MSKMKRWFWKLVYWFPNWRADRRRKQYENGPARWFTAEQRETSAYFIGPLKPNIEVGDVMELGSGAWHVMDMRPRRIVNEHGREVILGWDVTLSQTDDAQEGASKCLTLS